jgi:excisionase family DNA binding protein
VSEVAERLGVDQKTVRRAIADNVILGVWIRKRLLVPRPWFERWLLGEATCPSRSDPLPAQETSSRRSR